MILGNDPDIELVGKVRDLEEIPTKVRQLHPNILLVDIHEQDQNAIAAIRHAKQAYPRLKILALTISGTFKSSKPYREAGVSALIRPDTELRELTQLIRRVARSAKEDHCGIIRAADRRGPQNVGKTNYQIKTSRLKKRAPAKMVG